MNKAYISCIMKLKNIQCMSLLIMVLVYMKNNYFLKLTQDVLEYCYYMQKSHNIKFEIIIFRRPSNIVGASQLKNYITILI